jgi:hypothetical protein
MIFSGSPGDNFEQKYKSLLVRLEILEALVSKLSGSTLCTSPSGKVKDSSTDSLCYLTSTVGLQHQRISKVEGEIRALQGQN